MTSRRRRKATRELEKFQRYQSRHPDRYRTEEDRDRAHQRRFSRQPRKMQRLIAGQQQPKSDGKQAAGSDAPTEDRDPAWLPPSLKNRADRQVDLIVNHLKGCPITDVYLELGNSIPCC